MKTIYDFEVTMPNGEKRSLAQYKGNVLVIVNTASKCGFTPQFKQLQDLYVKYQDKGLEILGFPCGQFNDQEFSDIAETTQFCQVNYGVTFPMFAKIDVNGKDAHPLFTFLKEQQQGVLSTNIKWNFTKFLIDRNGNVVKRYAPITTPEKIEGDLKNLL